MKQPEARDAKRRQPESRAGKLARESDAGHADDPLGIIGAGPGTIDSLDRTRIAIPLLDLINEDDSALRHVIIDVNLLSRDGRREARLRLWRMVDALPGVTASCPDRPGKQAEPADGARQGVNRWKSLYSEQYLFAVLSGGNVRALVAASEAEAPPDGRGAPLYRVWLDHEIVSFTNQSISTVKADAAQKAFNALGKGIVWAVIDTGVDGDHKHFEKHHNLELPAPLMHRDFTSMEEPSASEASARVDHDGHGTHVAGILAGCYEAEEGAPIEARVRVRDASGNHRLDVLPDVERMSGMAPACKILSLKVFDEAKGGHTSNLIAAMEYVHELNGGGRRFLVHGVNLSVGYDFEPQWFACGQSPLCIEVDRLVRSGVVVVVAAGNTGYGALQVAGRAGKVPAGQDLTINDPGNAEAAITVGSTHRDMPHVYGVSYFSSKGPTGDGRLKPDLVAPGEKIVSCCSSSQAAPLPGSRPGAIVYQERNGTSMAAPHVSGVIAAFLSVRREFIGRPQAVKEVFMETATDLKREAYFQGRGLVDLMRAIQSV